MRWGLWLFLLFSIEDIYAIPKGRIFSLKHILYLGSDALARI
jgi:hypothetical protein